MKFFIILIISLGIKLDGVAELVFPPDIANAISTSGTGESGGLFVRGVERQTFIDYLCKNWREITKNIEILPDTKGNFYKKSDAFNASVNTFGAACESLPPEEYLEFLEQFVGLYEDKRIGYMPFDFQLSGSDKKECFLEVNWEHPRVQGIISRARRLIPPSEISTLSWLDEAAKGELADNYMTNKSDDAPLPETLPGIKLKRPWGSLIKKFELITGKKVPHDPKFDPRPSRRGGGSGESAAARTEDQPIWPWFACVTALFVLSFLIWRMRARRSSHS